ncbi:FAD-dependent oxidoreductase [Azospirillum sp. RWY-5-1]|uniref:FAD-dependent oxidoreductase n=1 Tax=Azospirillum oleiclasticum TaxID=2735135 RepID=A0ABX2TKJ6_9PROT|nr:FAD-dependent oxidoreductase [Azospirillum oleiclasticum]NYZ17491.1 FAD-dependent oxidoreductase [Azospirillum oleiclasticum]NYZ24869.1 FAD-dependent oxidoreductase [Azospirillum oleiclasticum]
MTAETTTAETTGVLIVGGGPCGLMLANELGRRGVATILIDQKPSTAFNPQANATQARTMEHFRRLGFADEIRAQGLPPEHPTDVAYFTRFTAHELARFPLPGSREAARLIRRKDRAWSAAEPAHRVSQKFVEAVLRRHADAQPSVSVRYGWRLCAFQETAGGVEAEVVPEGSGEPRRIRALYLVGADGPRSFVRRELGFAYEGEGSADRDFMGGTMLALYLRAPDFYAACPHPRAWQYWAFNRERRAVMGAVDGRGEFAFHTQLRPGESAESLSDADAVALFTQAMGVSIPVEVLSRDAWIAGRTLVANRFQQGRVFLGGDAVHLFTPTGGMGYNTAIEDAVNLGWKLAGVVTGRAPPSLLDSYELERRPVALRNTGFARRFAESIGLYRPSPALEEAGEAGEAARRRAGLYLEAHARAEFDIPGFTLGARYDASPIIAGDGSPPPPDGPTVYVPTGKPGGRAPHLWLDETRSLYDLFGFDWTLLRLGPKPPSADAHVEAARRMGVSLTVVDCAEPEAQDLYETDLVLIRPDQVIAWRRTGVDTRTPDEVFSIVTGRALVREMAG